MSILHFLNIYLLVYGCFAYLYVLHIPHAYNVCRGQKRALYPLELQLQVDIIYHMVAKIQTQVP